VRVHDDVGVDSLLRERHVLLPVRDTARAFLAVARAELVANLRDAHLTHADCDTFRALAIRSHHHRIHNA
jgi:hypothetical protein